MSDELIIESQGGEEKQNPYVPASDVCNGLNTLVPQAMAHESKNWNLSLSTKIGMPVDDYVMGKLKYTDYEEFCKAFAKEQVDAIATSIYNFETTGNGIILADATGVGKGRVVAGLLRYAVVNLGVVPMFFTDKINLINDIYRDMVDIQWDTAVPMFFKKKVEIDAKDFTDEEIYDIIKQDIGDGDGELRVSFDLPENEDGEPISLKELINGDYSDYIDELIDLYRQLLSEEGNFQVVYEKNINYDKQVYMAEKMGKMKVLPFIPNKPTQPVKDKMGNILYELKGSDIDKIIKSGNLPNEYKVICAPYSQVRSMYDSKGNLTDKAKFWLKYSNNTVIILDESHNASGSKEGAGQKQSNTFLMISKMLQNCRYATYVSATFAKRPESMPIYSLKTSLSELNMPLPSIINAFKIGGLPVQEATAAQLVRIGQLVRREKEITGITEYFYADPDSVDENIASTAKDQIIKLNRVSQSFDLVNEFSQTVQEHFKKALEMFVDKDQRKLYKFSGKTQRFSFLLFNFFLLGLKTRQTYQHAIKQLSSGKKVVIAIANTMESAFDNMKKDYIENVKYELGDVMTNDFSLYCAYLLSYTTQFTKIDTKVLDDGTIKEERLKYNFRDIDKIDDDICLKIAEYVHFRIESEFKKSIDTILENKIGTPLSPIDIIKSSIEEAGFKIDEVTGRGRNLVFSKDESGDFDFSTGQIQKRKKAKKDEVFQRFQENDLDCIILNQTGAVGASLHAIPTFNAIGEIVEPVNVIKDIDVKDIKERVAPSSLTPKNEVKQRYMIITQMELDVNKEVQKLGRIDRTGQVLPPMYGYLISAVPSENRLSAMMERKLRSLSANTSANQSQAEDLYSADDFFSNDAVEPFNETMTDLGISYKAKNGVNSNQQNQSIYDFTKIMYFASYQVQNDFYKTFSKKLNEHIAYLKSNNIYTGAMQIKDYSAKTLEIKPLLIGNNSSLSPFGRHAFIDQSEVTVFDEKIRESEIKNKIEANLNVTDDSGVRAFNDLTEYIKYWDSRTQSFLKRKRDEFDMEINESNDSIRTLNEKILSLNDELKSFDLLKEAIDLFNSIDEKNKEISQLSEKVQSLIIEGNLDEMNKVALQIQQVKKESEKLQSKFDSKPEYKSVLADQDRPNEIHRDIERAKSVMEDIKIKIDKTNSNYLELESNVSIFKQYLNGIGKIHNLTIFEEDRVSNYDEETEQYIEKFTYTTVVEKEQVVIYSVDFDGGEYVNFTLGRVKVKYAKVTSTDSTSLTKIAEPIDEKYLLMGRKHTVILENTNQSYVKNWTNYIKNINTGRQTEKIFVTGNLLKAFGSVLAGDSTGSVIKYSTSDGKVRIGYELGKESQVRFKQAFIEGSNYAIYFDLIYENFQKLVLRHFKKRVESFPTAREANRGIYMQIIGTSDDTLFMLIKSEAKYENTYDELVDEDNIQVHILSTKMASTDGVLDLMRRSGVSADSISYETNNTKPYISKVTNEPITQTYQLPPLKYWDVQPNETIFSTYGALSYLKEKNKIDFKFRLKFNLSSLKSLLDSMLYERRIFTGVTSSDIVEQNKDFYVFEQYADEVAEITSEGIQDPTDSLKEIEDSINYLVSILS
jgi:hypothetical protein